MGLTILSILKRFFSLQNYSPKKLKNIVFPYICLNKDISFNITCTLLKLYMPVLEYVMEGTMSQIVDLGPSFYFMKCRK